MVFQHKPVLLSVVLELLPKPLNGIYVDATLGGGGYSLGILKSIGTEGYVLGVDRDIDAIRASRERLSQYENNFKAVHGNFANLDKILDAQKIDKVDGIVFDLGVSSYQLDTPDRGFTFKDDSFLDMRMDQAQGKTAADLLAELSERELSRIFWLYGEEKWAKRIASFIVEYRSKEGPVEKASELVEIIKKAIPARARRKGRHPARRVFQALRIVVNSELESLQDGLKHGVEYLKENGIICAIAYHSLEDRIVKKTFAKFARSCHCPPHLPVCVCQGKAQLKIITSKPVLPSPQEIKSNPRARSARLRGAQKLHP